MATGNPGAASVNEIALGDLTGQTNAHAEVDYFTFQQDSPGECVIPSEISSWSRIKQRFE